MELATALKENYTRVTLDFSGIKGVTNDFSCSAMGELANNEELDLDSDILFFDNILYEVLHSE